MQQRRLHAAGSNGSAGSSSSPASLAVSSPSTRVFLYQSSADHTVVSVSRCFRQVAIVDGWVGGYAGEREESSEIQQEEVGGESQTPSCGGSGSAGVAWVAGGCQGHGTSRQRQRFVHPTHQRQRVCLKAYRTTAEQKASTRCPPRAHDCSKLNIFLGTRNKLNLPAVCAPSLCFMGLAAFTRSTFPYSSAPANKAQPTPSSPQRRREAGRGDTTGETQEGIASKLRTRAAAPAGVWLHRSSTEPFALRDSIVYACEGSFCARSLRPSAPTNC